MLVGPQIVSSIEQKRKPKNPLKDRITPLSQPVTVDYAPAFDRPEPRERSDTTSTSSESWQSCGTHPASDSPLTPTTPQDEGAADVKMHPCESKRLSPAAADCQDEKQARDDSKTWVPLYGGPPVYAEDTETNAESVPELTSDSSESFEDQGPSCILLNALHVQDVFDMPNIGTGRRYIGEPRFRPARLPGAINLRNLNIQQIKYSTISDIILYAKSGVTDGLLEVAEMVAQAQENLYQFRMEDYYQHVADGSAQEGIDKPVRYGVWCIVGKLPLPQDKDLQLINRTIPQTRKVLPSPGKPRLEWQSHIQLFVD
jgi:dual specificity MAP kinase phosphatase